MKLRFFKLFLFIVLLALISSIIFLSVKNDKNEIKKVVDVAKTYFNKSLQSEKVNLLSLSLALSENYDLKHAIKSEDEDLGQKILSTLTLKFKKYTNMKDMKLQVITDDYFLFARSWESGFSGFPLWWFRDEKYDNSKIIEPKSGIEIGMMLTIRSTVPIIDKDVVIGYLESLKLLDEFSLKLRSNGIELFVLMNQEYLEEASLMRENSRIGDFVLSNMSASKSYFRHLKSISFEKLESEHFVYDKDTLFIYEPMYNARGKKLGVFVLVVFPETFSKISNNDSLYTFGQDISSQEFSDVVESWEKPLGGYKEFSHKEIIQLLPNLHKKDSIVMKKRAEKFLREYDKDELIDIILNSARKMRKIGEIK